MHKVLVISVGKLSGGVERYTLMLKKYLQDGQYELHFAVRENSWLAKNLKSNHMLEVGMGKKIVLGMRAIKKYVERNNIHIIHCNSNNALFVSLLIRESAKRKKIGVIHGDVVVDKKSKGKLTLFIYEKLENWLLKNTCSKCVVVSKSLKNILTKRGIPEEKIEIIYNAAEEARYESKPDYYQKQMKICTMGYLMSQKNQMLLLEALNYLKIYEPNIQFICDIYGEGTEKTRLEKYIKDNNLREVRLMGFDSEARNKLNQYMLYIQPSVYESFGIAVVEAMYGGCYVLVNDVGGMREIVNERIGSIISMTSGERLANTIKELYFNRSLVERKAIAGQKYVTEIFSIERMIFSYYDIYKRVIGEQCEHQDT